MNVFKKTSLAVVATFGMSFAQIWTSEAPYGQVAFQWIVECQADPSLFDETDSDNDCFKKMGGWWFGYVAGPGVGARACDGDKSGTNKVEAKINGTFQSFVGPDYPSCEGPAITDLETGTTILDGGLEIKFTTGAGDEAEYEPDIAAIAVNFSTPPNIDRDMTQYTNGFCIKYTSDHTDSENLALELGWNEGSAGSVYGYDTWIADIPPVANSNYGTERTECYQWDLSTIATNATGPRVSGDFVQENWSSNPPSIEVATKEMRALKIRLKQYEAVEVNFKLIELSFSGGGTPVAPVNQLANSISHELVGRTLSINSITKSASVQIVNLHGAVVQTKTVSPNANSLNLSNLSSGVYFVRVPAFGYVNKIMIK